MEEKCILMDVKRFAVHDGPGIRTTLFLKGCSLKCAWCHNPEGISPKPQLAYYAHKCVSCRVCAGVCPVGAHVFALGGHKLLRDKCVSCGECASVCPGEAFRLFGREVGVDEAFSLATEDRAFYGERGGVTLSGGEPLLRADFARALLSRLKAAGVNTAVDTCGNVPWENFERVIEFADIFLYDIKHISPAAHRALTGSGNERILDNIARLSLAGARIEVRMPLVPGLNDDAATIDAIGEFLSKLNIENMRILPYHSMARSKYQALSMEDTMPDCESPTDERLCEVAKRLQALGVRAVSGRE